MKEVVARTDGASYVSLDDLDTRTAAETDPRSFVENQPGMLAIDEVQRVPELLLAIKATVDVDERPGRFLVTGSYQLSATRGVSETLAGRIERFELWPLAQSELAGTVGTFLDRLLAGQLPEVAPQPLSKLDRRQATRSAPSSKASSTIGARDVKHLSAFRDKIGSMFAGGVLLYAGTQVLPLGDRLVAAPISTIWAD